MENPHNGANITIGTSLSPTPAKVIPLLEATRRVEELTSALAIRLDPITDHSPTTADVQAPASTITSRLQSVGDSLQYLLDNIEL